MKAILLLPLIVFLISCSNVDKSKTEFSPSDVALQVTEDRFNLHVDIIEAPYDKNSKIREFNTAYQNNICEIAVDTETLKVTKMDCKTVPSNKEKQLDKIFTEKGKAALKKMEDEIASQ